MPATSGNTNQYWDIDLLFAPPDNMTWSVMSGKMTVLDLVNGTGKGNMDLVR